MAEGTSAALKMEEAVDLVCDVTLMKKETEEEPGVRKEDHDIKIRPTQVKQMLKTFKLFDRNDDKALDINEMAAVFRALGQNPTPAELKVIIDKVDTDGDGKVNREQYIQLLTTHMQSKKEVEEEMREAFKEFDKNNDGTVDKQELIKVLWTTGDALTTKEADDLMATMDTNRDGLIDVEEFVRYLCSGYPNIEDIK